MGDAGRGCVGCVTVELGWGCVGCVTLDIVSSGGWWGCSGSWTRNHGTHRTSHHHQGSNYSAWLEVLMEF